MDGFFIAIIAFILFSPIVFLVVRWYRWGFFSKDSPYFIIGYLPEEVLRRFYGKRS